MDTVDLYKYHQNRFATLTTGTGRAAELSASVGHRLEGPRFESRKGHGCGF